MTFDEFVAARLTALVRYAAVLAGDRDLAQDVVQDALVKAHARWGRVQEPEAFVRRMIVREYLSWRRRGAGPADPSTPGKLRILESYCCHSDHSTPRS